MYNHESDSYSFLTGFLNLGALLTGLCLDLLLLSETELYALSTYTFPDEPSFDCTPPLPPWPELPGITTELPWCELKRFVELFTYY